MSNFFDSKYQEARNSSKVKLTKKQKESLGITGDNPIILTQEQAATLLDITHATLSAWETDPTKHPRIDKVKIMSELYDCDIDYLVGIQNEKKKTYKHASEETGLSYKAIETLQDSNKEFCAIVSDLIENREFLEKMKELRLKHRIINNPVADVTGLSSDKAFSDSLRSGELDLWEHVKKFCEK